MADLAGNCVRTTCPYCGVGCGVETRAPSMGDIEVSGDTSHPANQGRLCVKGTALASTLITHNRLLHPLIEGKRVSWDEAIAHTTGTFRRIIDQHGPDAVAFYVSGQLLTEDYYIANKLMKGFIGSANIDTNSRLCMASAVAGYKRAFGSDAVPCSYEDLECCDLLVLTGSNTAWNHPVLYQRMSAAKAARPQMKVVVIDPRRTATCDLADLHLPIAPGSDGFLFSGLLAWLKSHDITDDEYLGKYCEGQDEAFATVTDISPRHVAENCAIPLESVIDFYTLFAGTEKTVTFYSQGINQSTTGTDKCNAIINCHLATGRIGRAGMGPFSITGQPNAMGGREVGGLANQLAAHMDFQPEHIATVRDFWQAPDIATRPGLKAVDLFKAMHEGKIRALWIVATNPMVSLPDTTYVREALQRCEFVVLSDFVRNNDTAPFAHVQLPSTTWSEKSGTVTNSERCISRQRGFLPPPGEARDDWRIFRDVAHGLGYSQAFDYTGPEDIFREHAALSGFRNTGTRLFDISAFASISKQQYDDLQPICWPVTAQAPQGTARLFTDGRFYTPSGKARLVPVLPRLPHTATTAPFVLNTGRLRDQWHTMTRTGLSPRLLQHIDSPFAALHPDTVKALSLDTGTLVKISNGRGELLLPWRADAGQRRDAVFVPIHWNRQFASDAVVSSLIEAKADAISGQPESKYARVHLAPYPIRQWMCVVASASLAHQLCAGSDYWSLRPVDGGFCYHLAFRNESTDRASSLAATLFPNERVITFSDEDRAVQRLLLVRKDSVVGMIASGQQPADLPRSDWLQKLLTLDQKADWLLLAGEELSREQKGPIVCSCHEVGRNQIVTAIQQGTGTVEGLGKSLRCGTNCGSCIPELKALITETQVTEPLCVPGDM